jgi:hypothetical protein
MQQCLYFLPLPQGHGALRPILSVMDDLGCRLELPAMSCGEINC